MAYMSQEKKKEIAAALKEVVPKSWKYSLGVRHHSTIVMTIRSAPIDLIAERNQAVADKLDRGYQVVKDNFSVNPYNGEICLTKSAEIFRKILKILNTGNYDNSDIMTDYFDVNFYVDLRVGEWNKPFVMK